MKPPKLSDDDALVAEWVGKIVDDANDDAELEFFERPWDTHPPLRVTVTAASIERAAIADAERGNFKPLADVIEKGSPSPMARAMIAAKLRGTFKGRSGAPKKTFLEHDLDPKYGAAKEVEKIIHVLNRYYPKAKGHTQRAIAIAAMRAGIDPEKFSNYYLKSRHRRRPT